MNRAHAPLMLVLLMTALGAAGESPPSPWPMTIPQAEGTITLYQPQLERLDGITLTGRAAASYLASGRGEDQRVFGALWFTAILDVDRDSNIAKARKLTITKLMTPKGERTAAAASVERAIEQAVLAQGLEIDLDRVAATLEDQPDQGHSDDFSESTPRILIRTTPTVLVVVDGAVKLQEVGGVKRIVNASTFVVVDPAGSWWLRCENGWLSAPAMAGPWVMPERKPPAAVEAAAIQAGLAPAEVVAARASPPDVIFATEPTELVVFAGSPAFAPIGDGRLLGATNTGTTALIEVASGSQWLLITGRWFSADRLDDQAGWRLVAPDEVPTAFADLPAQPPWNTVRAHIAGTPEAEAAIAEQQIPQTARIPRTATITLTFDGDARWQPIADRPVEYALNTADAVFRIAGNDHYACRDGVWYQGKDLAAPLTVATAIPDALRHLPSDCPWSNCSYVAVYESEPAYVWCGYTPGYLGWYAWRGAAVYGTGHVYHGWYGAATYPRPVTYGAAVHYNQYTGWSATIAVSGGSRAYANTAVIRVGGSIDITTGDTVVIANGEKYAPRASQLPAVYDHVPGAQRPQMQDAAKRVYAPTTADAAAVDRATANYAVDRSGAIGRPSADGSWQVRQDGQWQAADVAVTSPAAVKPADAAGTTTRSGTTPARAAPASAPGPATTTTAAGAKPAKKSPRPTPTPPASQAQSFQRTAQQRAQGEQNVQQRRQSAPPATRTAAPARTGGGSRR